MSSPEAFTPEIKPTTPETKPTTPETTVKPKKVTPEAATQEAENILESKETKVVLDKMKKIDDYINSISGEELNSYKWIILEYKSIKDDIKQKMEEDPNFKEAMKQAWKHLDNNQPLNTLGEPTAWKIASEALAEKVTQQQVEKANYVITWYDKLNPNQQEILNRWLAAFKDRIENVATQLGLNLQNYEVRKAAK